MGESPPCDLEGLTEKGASYEQSQRCRGSNSGRGELHRFLCDVAAPAFADSIAYDLNGDGLRETTVFDDEGHDGMYETIKTDVNADKHWDLVMYDRDLNGRAEFATFDQGDDGDFEWILKDEDQNGNYENVFNRNIDQRTPMEKAMENPDFARVMSQINENNANNARLWLLDDHDGLGNDDDLDGRTNAGDRDPTDPYN